MAIYPSSIPNTSDYPDRTDDVDWLYAARYNEIKNELLAICQELGVLPKGSYASVKDRLDALGSGITEGWEKVAEVNVASDSDYVDFTGLDSDSDWFYMLIATVKNSASSGCWYYLYVNGDYTKADYYMQRIDGIDTSVGGNRLNYPGFGYADNSKRTFFKGSITRDPDGYFRFLSSVTMSSGSSIWGQIIWGSKTATITNITSLRLSAQQTSGIGAGSKFILLRTKRS